MFYLTVSFLQQIIKVFVVSYKQNETSFAILFAL